MVKSNAIESINMVHDKMHVIEMTAIVPNMAPLYPPIKNPHNMGKNISPQPAPNIIILRIRRRKDRLKDRCSTSREFVKHPETIISVAATDEHDNEEKA